jgi:ATP-binding cassette subfamily C exporter for protease/lipase
MSPSVRQSFYITLAVTVLSLATVVYMLQVYDRITSTKSMDTLLSLTIAVVGALIVAELLEAIRTKLLQRATMKLEIDLSERVFRAMHNANLLKLPGVNLQQMQDLGALRTFLFSPGMMALLELPSSLFFLVLIFIINPQLGYFSLVGLAVQGGITWINATRVDPLLRKAQNSSLTSMYYCYEIMRSSQVMHALGMSRNMENLWLQKQKQMIAEQAKASDVAGVVMSASKFIGMAQGSLLLGLGCLLTIYGLMEGGGGMLIVASIIGGKALSPLVQILSSWKGMVEARMAFDRLESLLSSCPDKPQGMPLPAPQGQLSVENLVLAAPGYPVPILKGLNFNLEAGKTLVVIGASASGKSTLTRALLGIWPTLNGKVRLDGVDINQWHKDELGQHIGYLPQEVDLFDGTVAENIARFGKLDRDHIRELCQLINVHDVIEKLPQGYDSFVGDEGVVFSGGQRQRIGLARALYGNPRLVVMDEPNSNLDQENEAFLIKGIRYLKGLGTTQVIVTHRDSLIAEADYILVMANGLIRSFGTREQILTALQPPPANPVQQSTEQTAEATASAPTDHSKSGATP